MYKTQEVIILLSLMCLWVYFEIDFLKKVLKPLIALFSLLHFDVLVRQKLRYSLTSLESGSFPSFPQDHETIRSS